MRHLLTTKGTAQLMCSFVLSRLNYCNSLLIDINCDEMYRQQKAKTTQRSVFCLFLTKSRHEHIRPLFNALHWLRVKERVIFTIATFVFLFFDGTLPPYLSSCLSVYTPSCTLSSSSDGKESLCKVENEMLWLPVLLCSGSPCLEQPFCSYLTLQFSLTVLHFS